MKVKFSFCSMAKYILHSKNQYNIKFGTENNQDTHTLNRIN